LARVPEDEYIITSSFGSFTWTGGVIIPEIPYTLSEFYSLSSGATANVLIPPTITGLSVTPVFSNDLSILGDMATASGDITAGNGNFLSSKSLEATIQLKSTKDSGSWTAAENLGNIEFYGSDVSGAGAGVFASIRGRNTTLGGGRCALVFSTADGSTNDVERLTIKTSGVINIVNTPTYADNTAAKAGFLVDGDVYRTATGAMMIVYT